MTRDDLLTVIGDAAPEDLPGWVGACAEAQAFAQARIAAREPSEAQPTPGSLLTMREVAERLGVPEEYARERGRRGDLATVRLGRHVRVRTEDLQDFIVRNRSPIDENLFSTYSPLCDGRRNTPHPKANGPHPGRTRGSDRNHGKLRRTPGARGDRNLGAGGSSPAALGEGVEAAEGSTE